jgi:hypothetical protein
MVVPDEFLPEIFFIYSKYHPRSRGGQKSQDFEGQIRRPHTLLIIRVPKGDLPGIATHFFEFT